MCLTHEMGITFVTRGSKPTLEDSLKVDESRVYFNGKTISKERWRAQSLQIGLPPDIYLDIASKVQAERGYHTVSHLDQKFLVGVGGVVESRYGPHTEVVSIARYS